MIYHLQSAPTFVSTCTSTTAILPISLQSSVKILLSSVVLHPRNTAEHFGGARRVFLPFKTLGSNGSARCATLLGAFTALAIGPTERACLATCLSDTQGLIASNLASNELKSLRQISRALATIDAERLFGDRLDTIEASFPFDRLIVITTSPNLADVLC